jgi:N-acetylmuramoyl-L-alanine amidase
MLEKKGKKVILTRKGDQVLSIKNRVKAANQRSPEIFISLHISSKNEFGIYTAPKITGQSQSRTEKASEQDSDKNIANAIASNIKNELGLNVRRESMPLSAIAYVNAPALLLELPNPEKFHYDKKNKERLINIILKGIASSSAQGSPIKNGKGQVSAGGK